MRVIKDIKFINLSLKYVKKINGIIKAADLWNNIPAKVSIKYLIIFLSLIAISDKRTKEKATPCLVNPMKTTIII